MIGKKMNSYKCINEDGKYNEYCMKFTNEEIRDAFCSKFNEEVRLKMICIAEDDSKIDFESNKKIQTVAFDEKENIAIMFWGYQTSIFAYDKELMFIDEDTKGTYTSGDVFENAVYEGKLREMSHEQMLNMFVKVISCFIEAISVNITQYDVPETSGYQEYSDCEPHMFIINVENDHTDRKFQTFENITIHY